MRRTLSLKKEALLDLDDEDLLGIGAGQFTEVSCRGSCYAVVSCRVTECLFDRSQLCL